MSALPSIAGEALKQGTCSAGKRATKPMSWATAPQRAARGLAFPPAPRTAPFRQKKISSVTKTPTNDHRGIQFTVIPPERFHQMFSGDVSGLRTEPSPPAALLPRGASAPSSSRLFPAQPSPVEVIKGEKKKKKKAMQGFVFLLCGRGWGAAYGIYYFALLLKQNAFAQTRPRKEPAHVARTLGPS